MGILIRFFLRNIREKKLRTALIVLSVMISTSLFFASIAISGTVEAMHIERLKAFYGDSDIMIEPTSRSGSRFFFPTKASAVSNQTEYMVGLLQSSGELRKGSDTLELDILGIRLEDAATVNPIRFPKGEQLLSLGGREIILGRQVCERFDLQVGDSVDIEMNGTRRRFHLAAIALPLGPFQETGRTARAVIPYETASGFFAARGRVSVLLIKLKDPDTSEQTIAALSRIFPRHNVRQSLSRAEVEQFSRQITVPFRLMVTFVLLMSVYIIYSSFRVIVAERLPVIGTFRSLGASRFMTDLVLLGESLLYGVIGGTLGCFGGIGVLYIMSKLTTPSWMRGAAAGIRFEAGQLVLSFVLAVVLALISSLLPILRSSRIPIKDIFLNLVAKPVHRRPWRLVVGAVGLTVSLVLPRFVPDPLVMVVNTFLLILSLVALILLVPYLTFLAVKLLKRIYPPVFGNEGLLATQNLRSSRSMLNNISLLAIGISSLLMINTVSHSVHSEVASLFKDARFQIYMWTWQADRSIVQRLKAVEGVEDARGFYETYQVDLPDRGETIHYLQGVPAEEFPDYWDLRFSGDGELLVKELQEDRNIIITQVLKRKLEVDEGDLLTLDTKRGKRDYRIIGFFNSLNSDGNYGLVGERNLKADMRLRYYRILHIKTRGDPEQALKNIEKRFGRRASWIRTVEQVERDNQASNAQMFLILRGFSVMILLIAVVGVFNNFIVSFLARRRSLAMLRSVGMSRRQGVKSLLVEAFSGGLIGAVVGLVAGFLLLLGVPGVVHAADLSLEIHYSLSIFLISLGIGIGLAVLASLNPASKSTHFNIIEALRYE